MFFNTLSTNLACEISVLEVTGRMSSSECMLSMGVHLWTPKQLRKAEFWALYMLFNWVRDIRLWISEP